MIPPEPENDERLPLWPGMSRRTEERIGFWFSIALITVIWGSATLWLDGRQWIRISIIFGAALVFIVGESLYRLIVHGRA